MVSAVAVGVAVAATLAIVLLERVLKSAVVAPLKERTPLRTRADWMVGLADDGTADVEESTDGSEETTDGDDDGDSTADAGSSTTGGDEDGER